MFAHTYSDVSSDIHNHPQEESNPLESASPKDRHRDHDHNPEFQRKVVLFSKKNDGGDKFIPIFALVAMAGYSSIIGWELVKQWLPSEQYDSFL